MLAGAKRVAQALVEFNPADAQPVVERPVTFTRQVESSIAADRVSMTGERKERAESEEREYICNAVL